MGLSGAARADNDHCADLLRQSLRQDLIGLPTGGAVITSSEAVAQDARSPAFCKVLGEIRPVDKTAPVINFEVNLPASWNHSLIQYGGGGLNGRLETALGPLRDEPPTIPTPLMRGYATFGTDAGHQNDREHDLQAFALNDEALINHAYAAYKKTHDVALALVKSYFGMPPAKVYFIGGSEGGREGMIAAQRFPADYDGIISTVPVLSWTGTNLAEYQEWQAMMHGGWMNASKVSLVQRAVLAACDKLDGIEDGVVARYEGCNAESNLRALRCKSGKDEGDSCLSERQWELVRLVGSPHAYGFVLAHGERDYPAFPRGGEANPGGFIPTFLPSMQPTAEDLGRMNYAAGDLRYFVVRDPTFSAPLDERRYEKRLKEVSSLMDLNDPDLSQFESRGGKLIIKENAADFLVAPESVYRYYKNVQSKMGKARAERFIRLYVAPWTQHGGQGVMKNGASVPDKVDLLSVLESWVEQGKAPPQQLVLTSYDHEGHPTRSWPLCPYGAYPHYVGGDPKAAESYVCRNL
jgi:Tannase and feruloyl esterase